MILFSFLYLILDGIIFHTAGTGKAREFCGVERGSAMELDVDSYTVGRVRARIREDGAIKL